MGGPGEVSLKAWLSFDEVETVCYWQRGHYRNGNYKGNMCEKNLQKHAAMCQEPRERGGGGGIRGP